MVQHDRIYVPVVDANEVVAIDLSQLPESPEELLDLLVSEAAPLSTWFDCARAYLQQGRIDGFDHIYETATSDETAVEVERYFGQKPTYERIQFFTARAAVLIAQAREEKTADAKTRLLSEARKLITQASTLDQNEQLVHLTSGLHSMARGDLQNASRDFKRASTCRNNGKANVVGYLAVAGLAYAQQQYKEALSYYRAALREFHGPACPAEVRLGIAACAFKLGDLATARAAYKRVLQLDPDCADAYLGLALLAASDANVQQGLADCLRNLLTAYQLDPGHVGVLAHLAHYCLLQGEAAKAEALARAALEGAEALPPGSAEAARAEALTLLARAYHAQGRVDEARAEYAKACALDKRSPLPRLGMAQGYCAAGQLVNAASELEEALKAAPGFYDALKILGQLLPALTRDGGGGGGGRGGDGGGRLSATVALLREATAKQPGDYVMWEMLGELLAPSDPAGALAAYKKALEAHTAAQAEVEKQRGAAAEAAAARRSAGGERAAARAAKKAAKEAAKKEKAERGDDDDMDNLFGSEDEDEEEEEDGGEAQDDTQAEEEPPIPDHVIPDRLLNNAAVLHYRSGDVSAALALLQRALQIMNRAEAAGGVPSAMHRATLNFNQARLMEAAGEYKQAEQLYKDVLAEHPTYIDCRLRLACMARARGDHPEALRHAQSALDAEGGHADALALLSQLHMERRDYEAAGKVLIQLIQDSGSKRDVYGRIGYANTYLYTAPKDRREGSAKKAESRFSKALDEYRSVLDSEPRNVWAANGCGAALAELGYLDAAQSIFSEVYASMALSDGFLTIPDVLINLANCHLARQDYQDAVHLYRTALDKLDHKHHPQVLLYLARALYDSNKLAEAQACLKKAIHLAPTDYKLRFNFALTMQEWAVRTFRKERPPGDPTKLQEFQRAELLLKEAHRHYEHLKVLGRERSGLDEVKLNAHVSFCAAQLQKTPDLLDAAVKEDYEARLRRHEQSKIREAAEAERRAEDLRRQAADEEARAKKEAMARAAQEKLEMRKAEWRQQADLIAEMEGGGPGGEGKGKRRRGEGGGKKRKDKGRKGAREEVGDLFGDEEEEAAGGTGEGSEEPEFDEAKHGGGGGSGDEEGEGARGGASGAKRKRQRLRAAAAAAADDDGGADAAAAELEDVEDQPADGGGDEAALEDGEDGVGGGGTGTGRRARRAAAALDDDEEEDAGAGAAGAENGGGGEGEGMEGVEGEAGGDVGAGAEAGAAEAAGNPQDLHRDLFGDEDED